MTRTDSPAVNPDASANAHAQRTVVIGGGLAGLAAAIRLADAGLPVTLVETRKHLGGRATSFTDPTTSLELDNCQHVLTRGCTNLTDLYDRLGVDEQIRWHRALHFAGAHGQLDTLEADDLPAPLHMLRPLLSMKNLTVGEKWAIVRGLSDLMQIPEKTRLSMGDQSFGHWLREHPQPQSAIDKFWSLIITSACNETVDRVAASHAIQVFQHGFLHNDAAYEIGLPTVPLARLYERAEQRLRDAGGQIILGHGAARFIHDHGRIKLIELDDRQEIAGDAFVSAVGFERLARLVDGPLAQADARFQNLDRFEHSPILGIHLLMRPRTDGRPLLDTPYVGLMDSPLHWVFHKGAGHRIDPAAAQQGEDTLAASAAGPVECEYLHGVISAAHELVDRPAEQLIRMALEQVRSHLPRTRRSELIFGKLIKEKRATFSAQPGIDRYRPATTGAIENLYLAGDWTDTGWPATMEGAVRSGYSAAAAILQRRGITIDSPLVPELPASRLYHWLAG